MGVIGGWKFTSHAAPATPGPNPASAAPAALVGVLVDVLIGVNPRASARLPVPFPLPLRTMLSPIVLAIPVPPSAVTAPP
jgi:hypothetical protein